MRLGDLDDLKVHISELMLVYSGEELDNAILNAIDNAPTVEVPENAVNCVLTVFGTCSYNETGCSDCKIKGKIRKALNGQPHIEHL